MTLTLNGIYSIVEQSDLSSRSISIHLSGITDSRMKESDLWKLFDLAKASMLGEICDGVASIINSDEPKVELGRMADFISWVSKAEETLGWGKNSFQ